MVKNPPEIQKTWIRSMGREESLEKRMPPHSNILAWRIPWTEESDRLPIVHAVKKSRNTTERLKLFTFP